MLLPAKKIIHKGLRTDYINIAAMLDVLNKDSFTGYIDIIDLHMAQTIILLEFGIPTAIWHNGKLAKIDIDNLPGSEPDGIVDLVELHPDMFPVVYKLLGTPLVDTSTVNGGHPLIEHILRFKKEYQDGIFDFSGGGSAGTMWLWEGKIYSFPVRSGAKVRSGPDVIKEVLPGLSGKINISCYANPLATQKESRQSVDDRLTAKNVEEVFTTVLNLVESRYKGDFRLDFLNFINHFYADDYPCLDPFVKNFDYINGKVILDETVKPSECATGLKKAIIHFIEDKNLDKGLIVEATASIKRLAM